MNDIIIYELFLLHYQECEICGEVGGELVQCDTCEAWYHLVCVGLKPTQSFADCQVFQCKACRGALDASCLSNLSTRLNNPGSLCWIRIMIAYS